MKTFLQFYIWFQISPSLLGHRSNGLRLTDAARRRLVQQPAVVIRTTSMVQQYGFCVFLQSPKYR